MCVCVLVFGIRVPFTFTPSHRMELDKAECWKRTQTDSESKTQSLWTMGMHGSIAALRFPLKIFAPIILLWQILFSFGCLRFARCHSMLISRLSFATMAVGVKKKQGEKVVERKWIYVRVPFFLSSLFSSSSSASSILVFQFIAVARAICRRMCVASRTQSSCERARAHTSRQSICKSFLLI